MMSKLKALWLASAHVENLVVELDQASYDRDAAVVEAVRAGFSLDEVAATANLSKTEVAGIALASPEYDDGGLTAPPGAAKLI